MSRLFDISQDFELMFERLEEIYDYEFPVNEKGETVDDDGNRVNAEVEKAEMIEAWFDTFEGVKEEFNFKAENIAQYVKCLKAEADEIDKEMKKLRARRDGKIRRADKLKEYLMGCMSVSKIKKIDMPRAKITIRKNQPSLKIEDELALINILQNTNRNDLLKYSLPEIRKNDIKTLVKSGESFEGVSLEASFSLIIT